MTLTGNSPSRITTYITKNVKELTIITIILAENLKCSVKKKDSLSLEPKHLNSQICSQTSAVGLNIPFKR